MLSEPFRLFVRLSRPLYLLAVALLYFLGAGIAHYLGTLIDQGLFALGLLWVLLLQLSTHYLLDYFNLGPEFQNPDRSPFTGGSGALGPGHLPRSTALWAAFGTLAALTSVTVLLLRSPNFEPAALPIMVLLVVGAVSYAIPPLRLAGSGYGELMVSFLVANLVPALAYLLQAGIFHRFLAMTTFPLMALHLAMVLVYEFPDFAQDIKYENPTMLVRMGWRNAMNLHNVLILMAYLLLGLAATSGLPALIAFPAFLPLPFGLLQIWQMSRIASGAAPNWQALKLTAVSLFAATAYLLTYAFWTR